MGMTSDRREERWRRVATFLGAMILISTAHLAQAGYEVVDVKDGGTIKGTIIWKGPIPQIPPLTVMADPDTCGETVPSPALQVDPKSKGVRFALVYLEQIEKGKAPADKYWLHMGQDSANKEPDTLLCQFKEHVFPFVRTQRVAMVNFDPILHNPHFFNEKRASVFNVAMPSPNVEVDHTLLREHGVGLPFQCDVHVHMNGYTFGFDHPYFAVTDSQGSFEITGIPPGKYTLVTWHEGIHIAKMTQGRPTYDEPQIIRQDVEIKPGGAVETRFELSTDKGGGIALTAASAGS